MEVVSARAFVLFFLWYGLKAFVPALATDMFMKNRCRIGPDRRHRCLAWPVLKT